VASWSYQISTASHVYRDTLWWVHPSREMTKRVCNNASQVKGSQLSKQHSAAVLPQPQPQSPPQESQAQAQQQLSAPLPDPKQLDAFAGSLRSARDIDMSLVVGRQHGVWHAWCADSSKCSTGIPFDQRELNAHIRYL
jgi:hypothetical protein